MKESFIPSSIIKDFSFPSDVVRKSVSIKENRFFGLMDRTLIEVLTE